MEHPNKWQIEYYVGQGSTFESWMDSLDDIKFAALSAAIELVLAPNGISLAGTPWLKHVEKGIFEFRIRYSAADIKAMYANLELDAPQPPTKILFRVFLHFHGSKIVLLLNGYDKAADDKPRRQQWEIKIAMQRLKRWQSSQN